MKKKKQKSRQKISKKLVPKLGIAFKNEYYLETTWILSSVIEMKLKSILGKIDTHYSPPAPKLDVTLKRIKFLLVKLSNPILNKYFEMRLIEELRNWKNYRNEVFRDMVHMHVSKLRMKKMAEEGIVLLQELNAVAKKIKSEWKKLQAEIAASSNPEDETGKAN
jgi:hypothetical protein